MRRCVPIILGTSAGLLVLVSSGCSSSDAANNATAGSSTETQNGAGGALAMDPATAEGSSAGGGAPDTSVPFSVEPESKVCQQDLMFKVPGCACVPGTPDQACWTGPPSDRHVDHCKDGVQKCAGKEIGQWGPCEGEVHTCHYPPEHIDAGKPDAGKPDSGTPPPPPCSCAPGATIGCDEDCQTLVICSLTGYKTCQPDGTWGPCHETTDLAGIVNNVLGCRNWLHGCLPGAEDGVFTGDCSQAFTCGHPPGAE